MSVEYTIVCDRCACIINASSKSVADARREIEPMGGMIRTSRRGAGRGEDVCPWCVADAASEPDVSSGLTVADGVKSTD